MNDLKMMSEDHLSGFVLGKSTDFLKVICAKFIDNFAKVRLDFKPLIVLDNYHSSKYYLPVLP